MKNNQLFQFRKAALLGLMILGVGFATGQTAGAATLTAFVADQQCQGGDFVQVTLSATIEPQQRVRYTWDFNNDGIFDTAPSSNPTVTTNYPDEVTVTATVKAIKGSRTVTDSVTFTTVRCGG